ncbi:MAG: hypothetical protein H8F28_20770 [Fibrella sp.]|nr:hypothetical protein [Armatimonadota bacterium]
MKKKMVPSLLLLLASILVTGVACKNNPAHPVAGALPDLPQLDGLKEISRAKPPVESITLSKVEAERNTLVKSTILASIPGQDAPDSQQLVRNITKDVGKLKSIVPEYNYQLSDVKETVINGNPACTYVITSSAKGKKSSRRSLDCSWKKSLYRFEVGVLSPTLNSSDELYASELFDKYSIILKDKLK